MQNEAIAPVFIEEKRLVKTLLSRKPGVNSFFAATLTVLIITLITLLYWNNFFNWSQYLPAVRAEVFENNQWWRNLTAVFIHADVEHLLSNMYMLWIFSYFIYGYFGFVIYPFFSFALAAVVNLLAIASYPPEVELLGASGLVYLLGGFWLILYFFIQRQYSWLNRLIRVLGVAFVIFLPSSFVPTTSYRTHAIGFLAGIILGLFYFYKNKKKIRAYEVYKTNLVEDVIVF